MAQLMDSCGRYSREKPPERKHQQKAGCKYAESRGNLHLIHTEAPPPEKPSGNKLLLHPAPALPPKAPASGVSVRKTRSLMRREVIAASTRMFPPASTDEPAAKTAERTCRLFHLSAFPSVPFFPDCVLTRIQLDMPPGPPPRSLCGNQDPHSIFHILHVHTIFQKLYASP